MTRTRRAISAVAATSIIITAGLLGAGQAHAAPLEAKGSATGTHKIAWCGSLASYAVAAASLSPITAPLVAAAIERDKQACS